MTEHIENVICEFDERQTVEVRPTDERDYGKEVVIIGSGGSRLEHMTVQRDTKSPLRTPSLLSRAWNWLLRREPPEITITLSITCMAFEEINGVDLRGDWNGSVVIKQHSGETYNVSDSDIHTVEFRND